MRRPSPRLLWIPIAFLAVGLLPLAGCSFLLPVAAQAVLQSNAGQSSSRQPAGPQSPSGQTVASQTGSEADSGATVGDAIANTVPEVRWLDDRNSPARGGAVPPGGLARAVATGALRGGIAAVAPAVNSTTRPSTSAALSGQAATGALNHSSTGVDRQVVLQQLRGMIRDNKDPAVIKALSAVALSVADPSVKLDPADLTALDPSLRQLVLGYYQLLGQPAAAPAVADSMVAVGPAATVAAGGAPDPALQPIEIRAVQLCRRVRGYGSVDPFESSTFLSGRDQKIWVYVELDHFRPTKNAKGLYEVRLNQGVSLYHDADGLEVWKQPDAEIVDESRNQRRDFFVVEPIVLPARLSVGKYLLKVRVIDRHGDSVAESSVPLQIVADQNLVAERK